MAQSENQSRRSVPTAIVLILALAAYAAIGFNAFHNAGVSFVEGRYLVKSWLYVTGTVTPYTTTDATWNAPLYYYLLGWWQSLMGVGAGPARALSLVLGALNAAFLFAIVRRLTANVLAAASAVLLLLATPTTAFTFALALPTAAVSLLHLVAIWLIVTGLGRPRVGASIAFGIVCAALYFTRQNMILAVVMLVPLYIAAIGTRRLPHTGIVVGAFAAVAAALVVVFPDKFAGFMLHLPIITPYLEHWGLLPADLTLIDQGTVGPTTMALALDRIHLADFVNAYLLPFFGIVVLSLLLFFIAGRGLRVLLLAPIYFCVLIVGHVIGTAGLCTACLPDYGSTFAAVGALCAALSLAVLASRARHVNTSPAVVIVGGALVGTALNVFAPALATRDAYLFYPAPLLARGTPTELADVETFSRWLAAAAPAGEPILLIHDLPVLPYAVFRGAHQFPMQNIDPDATHRVVRPRLSPTVSEAVQAAVEAETLWTDDTQRRWLERDYDLVLFQENKAVDQTAVKAALAHDFDAAGSTVFRGVSLTLYKRKTAQ